MKRKYITLVVVGGLAAAAGVAIGVSAAVTHRTSAPTTKDQYAQALASQRAAEIANHTPAPKVSPSLAPNGPAPQRQAGILNIHQGPVPTSVFVSSNLWEGPLSGDTWYLVYAGQNVNPDGTKGAPAVIVQTSTPSSDGSSFTIQTVGTFSYPAADGALTITAAGTGTLTLQTPSGHTITFNLQTRQFQ